MQRYFARNMQGGWFGVWDTEKRVYIVCGDQLHFEEEETAAAEAAKHEAEHDAARFNAFMLAGRDYWFTEKLAKEFEREFRRWFREGQGWRLSKEETKIGFNPQRGWFVDYKPKEE